ncbi:MAG: SprB repeat-containing protein, partial [Bacteroidota bacterium]
MPEHSHLIAPHRCGDYSYAWPDGLITTTANRAGLAAGVYSVTITDNASAAACELVYLFALNNDAPLVDVAIQDTLHLSCFGGNDGGVNASVLYGLGYNFPADTLITDGTNNYSNGFLEAGDYCLLIRDANGCINGSACFNLTAPDSLGLHFVVTPSCDLDGTIDLTVSGGTAPYTYDWLDLAGNSDPEDRDSVGFGLYSLIATDANGCTAAEPHVLVPACPDPGNCDYFNGLDSVYLQAVTCGGLADLCFPYTMDTFQNDFAVIVDGLPYSGDYVGCDFDTLTQYLYSQLFGEGTLGPYDVTSWPVEDTTFTGEFLTIDDLLDSMNLWDPSGNWMLDTLGKSLFGGNPSSEYGPMVIEALNFNTSSTLGVNFTLIPNGTAIQLNEGVHEVIVASAINGCADTLTAIVVCTNPDTVYVDIVVGQTDTVCVSDIELIGPIDTIYNACPDETFASFEVLTDTTCVVFTGLIPGNETACIVYCDSLGICDTTYAIITVDQSDDVVIDTIPVGAVVTYCIDTSLLDLVGPVTSIQNVCDSLSDGNVNFFIDSSDLCVT